MEIKTIEHYVVAKLQDQENEIDKLKAAAILKDAEQERLKLELDTLVNVLKEICRLDKSANTEPNKYLKFDYVYQRWDEDTFNFLMDIIKPKLEDSDDE